MELKVGMKLRRKETPVDTRFGMFCDMDTVFVVAKVEYLDAYIVPVGYKGTLSWRSDMLRWEDYWKPASDGVHYKNKHRRKYDTTNK